MMKQIFSNLKTVSKTTIFMLALLCAVVQGAWADAGDTTIPFHVVDIYPVTSKSTTLSASEYIVNSDVTVSSRITISGNVVLNLGEGKTLTASKGIELSEGNSLTINGPGALTIDDCEEYDSGIGAKRVGTLTINGGTINVTGGYLAASIGGSSRNEVGGTITINGGVVNATGGQSAAGIGGGRRGSSWGDTTKGQGYTTTAGGATAGGDGKVIITWYGTTHP